MMLDFWLALHEIGHIVTLVGGEAFKPSIRNNIPSRFCGGIVSVRNLSTSLPTVYPENI